MWGVRLHCKVRGWMRGGEIRWPARGTISRRPMALFCTESAASRKSYGAEINQPFALPCILPFEINT
jgi:hypothetical protein